MHIETKLAAVGKSYSALDFQTDVVVCVKVYELLDNIDIIAVSHELRLHTRNEPTRRQHIFRLALIYCQTQSIHELQLAVTGNVERLKIDLHINCQIYTVIFLAIH